MMSSNETPVSAKINCRHGLDKIQEIQARRIRAKLEAEEKETIEKYRRLWKAWSSVSKMSFEQYLVSQDVVVYSAYIRACQRKGKQVIYSKIAAHNFNF